jgi:hypothetical protein
MREEPMDGVEVRIRTWTRCSDDDARRGLLGFLSLAYGDLILDGVAVRRTADGRMTLSWPERRDRLGRAHPYLRPISDEARRRIEHAVFSAAVGEEAPW